MRIGIFGGTFDPVHRGHVLLADWCQLDAQLDRVVFVPAAHQPHKPNAPRASDAQRVDMLRLAIGDRPEFSVATIEIDRGGCSYTVDTLRALRAQAPADELFLLMGADALADLPKWREAAAICEMATPVAVRRAGWSEPDFNALAHLVTPQRRKEIRALQVDMPEAPVSSSEIQRLIGAGGDWQGLVEPAVADYIAEHGLYGAR